MIVDYFRRRSDGQPSHLSDVAFCDMEECAFNTEVFQSLDKRDEPLATYVHSQLEGEEGSYRNSDH